MGILNVTPDSFSDGGRFETAEEAVRAGLKMSEEGADYIDVGGESTRPGAAPVSMHEEIRRVTPVVDALARTGIVVSIDTMKPQVAEAALDAGAKIVNDVSGLRSEEMRGLCARYGVTVCIMHMQGEPRTMQENPSYNHVVEDVRRELLTRAADAEQAGIRRERIWIDPGIGFGKTLDHNLQLLRSLSVLAAEGYPVMVGASRKAFLGRLAGGECPVPVTERLAASLAAAIAARVNGASILRVHDVRATREALAVYESIQGSGGGVVAP